MAYIFYFYVKTSNSIKSFIRIVIERFYQFVVRQLDYRLSVYRDLYSCLETHSGYRCSSAASHYSDSTGQDFYGFDGMHDRFDYNYNSTY